MHRHPPAHEPEMPADLALPSVNAHTVAHYSALASGYLIELADGQQAVLIAVKKDAHGGQPALSAVRVSWPRDGVLPLGETYVLSAEEAQAEQPIKVVGAWFSATATVSAERVVLEAIRRGLITPRTCGVPWPLANTWQLSESAAAHIEQYLFEVARTTGCAFPFHDITAALRKMHLRPSLEHAAQCDIVAGETLGRAPRSDEEIIAIWARELARKMRSSDFGALPPLPPDATTGAP